MDLLHVCAENTCSTSHNSEMDKKDQLHRFTLDNATVRGELVQLSDSYETVLDKHDYPEPVQRLLGEFMAAAALLSATLKFNGILSLQAKSEGPISMLMAECRNQSTLRGIAAYDESLSPESETLGDGQLAITIEPDKGQSYQGIVEIKDHDLSAALTAYFLQSEQLPTRFWLATDSNPARAAGLLVQVLPESEHESQLTSGSEDWSRIEILSDTVKQEELTEVDPETLLFRLYHEEGVRLYPPSDLEFGCSCSRERGANSLLSIGRAETEAALAESGDEIKVDCHFCRARYVFTKQDITELFDSQVH